MGSGWAESLNVQATFASAQHHALEGMPWEWKGPGAGSTTGVGPQLPVSQGRRDSAHVACFHHKVQNPFYVPLGSDGV